MSKGAGRALANVDSFRSAVIHPCSHATKCFDVPSVFSVPEEIYLQSCITNLVNQSRYRATREKPEKGPRRAVSEIALPI